MARPILICFFAPVDTDVDSPVLFSISCVGEPAFAEVSLVEAALDDVLPVDPQAQNVAAIKAAISNAKNFFIFFLHNKCLIFEISETDPVFT